MTKRTTLRPIYQHWPAWLIRFFLLLLLPVFIVGGAIVGIIELLLEWQTTWRTVGYAVGGRTDDNLTPTVPLKNDKCPASDADVPRRDDPNWQLINDWDHVLRREKDQVQVRTYFWHTWKKLPDEWDGKTAREIDDKLEHAYLRFRFRKPIGT